MKIDFVSFYSPQLAENRKTLLDQTSVERQQDVENHQRKVEELKSKYENDIQELTNKNTEEIEDLKKQLVNLKVRSIQLYLSQ